MFERENRDLESVLSRKSFIVLLKNINSVAVMIVKHFMQGLTFELLLVSLKIKTLC